MASKSILLLGIFLVVATKVSSYDEDLKIQGSYAKPPVGSVAPPPKPLPTPSPPVVKAPYQPPPVTPTPPIVKSPPYPPVVKAPSPPPIVKSPPYPPSVKPPVAPATPPPSPSTPIVKSKKDCIPLCAYRCKLHSRTNVCTRACITCCDRCKCVPPGTYGNREKCGKCYTDMVTHGNRSKCP